MLHIDLTVLKNTTANELNKYFVLFMILYVLLFLRNNLNLNNQKPNGKGPRRTKAELEERVLIDVIVISLP